MIICLVCCIFEKRYLFDIILCEIWIYFDIGYIYLFFGLFEFFFKNICFLFECLKNMKLNYGVLVLNILYV